MIRRTYLQGGLGQVHARVAGPGDGRASGAPVLMFHETPSTSSEYDRLMEALAADRAVYAFDTPGYGGSDGGPPGLRIEDYVEAIAPAIEQLDLGRGRALAFGFHTGAVIAMELVLQRPDLAGALAVAGFPYRPMAERRQRLEALPREADAAAYREKVLFWYDLVVTNGAPDVPLDRRIALLTEMLRSGRDHWRAYEAVWTYDYEAKFAQMRAPTLFLAPHEMLYEQTLAAARMIKGAELKELPEAREWALERNARLVADALGAFADRTAVHA